MLESHMSQEEGTHSLYSTHIMKGFGDDLKRCVEISLFSHIDSYKKQCHCLILFVDLIRAL